MGSQSLDFVVIRNYAVARSPCSTERPGQHRFLRTRQAPFSDGTHDLGSQQKPREGIAGEMAGFSAGFSSPHYAAATALCATVHSGCDRGSMPVVRELSSNFSFEKLGGCRFEAESTGIMSSAVQAMTVTAIVFLHYLHRRPILGANDYGLERAQTNFRRRKSVSAWNSCVLILKLCQRPFVWCGDGAFAAPLRQLHLFDR